MVGRAHPTRDLHGHALRRDDCDTTGGATVDLAIAASVRSHRPSRFKSHLTATNTTPMLKPVAREWQRKSGYGGPAVWNDALAGVFLCREHSSEDGTTGTPLVRVVTVPC